MSSPSTAVSPKGSEATATLVTALERTLEAVVAKAAANDQRRTRHRRAPGARRAARVRRDRGRGGRGARRVHAGRRRGRGNRTPTTWRRRSRPRWRQSRGADRGAPRRLRADRRVLERTLRAAGGARRRPRRPARARVPRDRPRGHPQTRGANNACIDEICRRWRATPSAQFAAKEVAPHRRAHPPPRRARARGAHRARWRELGYFGMSVPEEYGGSGMGNLAMILTTEELSRASLAAAGSLITRPEILTKALLEGGTEAQKKQWLPPIAAGEIMVGISVTEPDTGSDVAVGAAAAPSRRASTARRAGVINGAKAWCTFAGRANVLALLARTDPDPKPGAQGPLALHRRRRTRSPATSSRCGSRAAARCTARPTRRPATAACTRSRSASTTTSCRPRTWSASEGGDRQGLLPADGRLRRGPAADRRARLRRRAGGARDAPPTTPASASSSASRSASSS